MLDDVFAHTKKSGLCAEWPEHVEYPGSELGDGAIIEGEVEPTRSGWYAPGVCGHQGLEQPGCFCDKHGFKIDNPTID